MPPAGTAAARRAAYLLNGRVVDVNMNPPPQPNRLLPPSAFGGGSDVSSNPSTGLFVSPAPAALLVPPELCPNFVPAPPPPPPPVASPYSVAPNASVGGAAPAAARSFGCIPTKKVTKKPTPPPAAPPAPVPEQYNAIDHIEEDKDAVAVKNVGDESDGSVSHAMCTFVRGSPGRVCVAAVCDGTDGRTAADFFRTTFQNCVRSGILSITPEPQTCFNFLAEVYTHTAKYTEQMNGSKVYAATVISTIDGVCGVKDENCCWGVFERRPPRLFDTKPPFYGKKIQLTEQSIKTKHSELKAGYILLDYEQKSFHGVRYLVICNRGATDAFGSVGELGRFVEDPTRFIQTTQKLKDQRTHFFPADNYAWREIINIFNGDAFLSGRSDDCRAAADYLRKKCPAAAPVRLAKMAKIAARVAVLLGAKQHVAIVIRQVEGPTPSPRGLHVVQPDAISARTILDPLDPFGHMPILQAAAWGGSSYMGIPPWHL